MPPALPAQPPHDVPGSGPEPLASVPISLTFTRHRRARRYVLRVATDGSVRVTIPPWGSKRGAADFADRERAWIEKERRRLTASAAAIANRGAQVDEAAARERAHRELPPRLLELAAANGLGVRKISVRNQRWRWGSCSTTGRICLNWRLVLTPDAVRDYVMIHELMHLRRMDHSSRFWKLVEQACPGYRDARQWLRQHGELLGT